MIPDNYLLQTKDLAIGYLPQKSGAGWAINDLNLSLSAGELVCLLGPNGAGKSTLLRTLSGLQQPLNGEVLIDGASLAATRPEALALKLSMVLTDRIDAPNMTAGELIALGRIPHTGWLGTLSANDRHKIEEAIALAGAGNYTNRKIHELSDGERQKVMLARALAQDTGLIFLDEPTSHLDVPNRVEMMHLLHEMARKTGKGILISTHELDLALQIADRIWLIDPQLKLSEGMPEDLVLDGTFERSFARPGFFFDKSNGSFHLNSVEAKYKVALTGPQIYQYWTSRALLKVSVKTSTDQTLTDRIEISETDGKPYWTLYSGMTKTVHDSLENLVAVFKDQTSQSSTSAFE